MHCYLCDLPLPEGVSQWYCEECSHSFKLPKLFIGVCGRARHGKDFFADVIKGRLSNLGIRTFVSSISNVVFDYAKQRGLVKAASRPECDKEDLAMLVKIGHQMREEDESYWYRHLTIRIADSESTVAVIPGVRFPDEIRWLRKSPSGILVRVTCFNKDGSMYISPDRDPNDPMETCLNRVVPDFDISAVRGQIDWLRWQATSFANYLETHTLYTEVLKERS